jgi:hypothetical protein
MNDTAAQGMVARGWIPSGLPSTAADVQVRWNLDMNRVRGRLRVSVNEVSTLASRMRSVDDATTPPFWQHGDVNPSWWPSDLMPPPDAATLRRRGWELLAVPDTSSTFIAVRRADGQLYFWGEGS